MEESEKHVMRERERLGTREQIKYYPIYVKFKNRWDFTVVTVVLYLDVG